MEKEHILRNLNIHLFRVNLMRVRIEVDIFILSSTMLDSALPLYTLSQRPSRRRCSTRPMSWGTRRSDLTSCSTRCSLPPSPSSWSNESRCRPKPMKWSPSTFPTSWASPNWPQRVPRCRYSFAFTSCWCGNPHVNLSPPLPFLWLCFFYSFTDFFNTLTSFFFSERSALSFRLKSLPPQSCLLIQFRFNIPPAGDLPPECPL